MTDQFPDTADSRHVGIGASFGALRRYPGPHGLCAGPSSAGALVRRVALAPGHVRVRPTAGHVHCSALVLVKVSTQDFSFTSVDVEKKKAASIAAITMVFHRQQNARCCAAEVPPRTESYHRQNRRLAAHVGRMQCRTAIVSPKAPHHLSPSAAVTSPAQQTRIWAQWTSSLLF